MMNLKKIMTLLVICVFAMSSMAFAAKGGAKISAPKAAPSVSSPQKAPETAAPSTTKDYKPSQDAKSLSKDAPAAKANTAAAAAKSSSPWGGMMRNIGLLAGGMLLGSMLGSMFGMGSGLFADILGLLMNVVLIGAVFMIGRMLWNKYKGRSKRDEENPYRRTPAEPMQASRREEIIDVTPPTKSTDYDSRTKANEYRNR